MQGTAMRQIAEFIAVLSCALPTGAAIYITLVEHPARMQCGVEIAATQFARSYRRATVMQATCAAVGAGCSDALLSSLPVSSSERSSTPSSIRLRGTLCVRDVMPSNPNHFQ
jgi:hypothetical protein